MPGLQLLTQLLPDFPSTPTQAPRFPTPIYIHIYIAYICTICHGAHILQLWLTIFVARAEQEREDPGLISHMPQLQLQLRLDPLAKDDVDAEVGCRAVERRDAGMLRCRAMGQESGVPSFGFLCFTWTGCSGDSSDDCPAKVFHLPAHQRFDFGFRPTAKRKQDDGQGSSCLGSPFFLQPSMALGLGFFSTCPQDILQIFLLSLPASPSSCVFTLCLSWLCTQALRIPLSGAGAPRSRKFAFFFLPNWNPPARVWSSFWVLRQI